MYLEEYDLTSLIHVFNVDYILTVDKSFNFYVQIQTVKILIL